MIAVLRPHLAPRPCAPARRRAVAPRLWLALAVLLAAGALHITRPSPAAAAVTRLHGFAATVDGWSSWYGSYGMGPLGPAWCIDHGSRAPDPAFGYAPADLRAVPPERQAAVAWVVARHGQGADPVAHAAVMLAVHDLMGATYPSGRLDVDRLTTDRMAGFGGQADAVLASARRFTADGRAHQGLLGPLSLGLSAGDRDPTGHTPLTVRIVDGAGQGVGGLGVDLEWPGQRQHLTTGDDGTATTLIPPSGTATPVRAAAAVPHLPLDAWASTTAPAQRVARPTLHQVTADATVAPATGRLRIHKTGDATAWVPVEGARFEATPVAGGPPVALVVGEDGHTDEVELPLGEHRVVETAPPPGYRAAGPWTVDVRADQTTVLEVLDEVERARLRLRKVDAATGEPLGFAGLTLRYDADADGAFDGTDDEVVAEVLSTREPIEVPDLLPGRYELREDLTPTGYQPLPAPLVVDLAPGQVVDLDVPNEAIPPPTTTTTVPPSTTTVPPSTTTVPPSTTTAPPPPEPATTAPAVPPESPPVTVASSGRVTPATLPRTGVDTASLTLAGLGLVLLGWSGIDLARRRSDRATAVVSRGRRPPAGR